MGAGQQGAGAKRCCANLCDQLVGARASLARVALVTSLHLSGPARRSCTLQHRAGPTCCIAVLLRLAACACPTSCREDVQQYEGPWPQRLFLAMGSKEFTGEHQTLQLQQSCRIVAAWMALHGCGIMRACTHWLWAAGNFCESRSFKKSVGGPCL